MMPVKGVSGATCGARGEGESDAQSTMGRLMPASHPASASPTRARARAASRSGTITPRGLP